MSEARAGTLERLYLWYLLLIPQGATFAAALTYRGPSGGNINAVIWLVGAVTVAIYAAFVAAFVGLPHARWRAALVVLDGPVVIAAAALTLHGWRVLDLASWFFLSEGLSVFLGMLVIAPRAPTPGLGAVTAGIALACAGAIAAFDGSVWGQLFADWRSAVLFAVGLVEGTIAAGAAFAGAKPVRDGDAQARWILLSLLLWHVAFGVGIAVRLNR